MKTKIMAVIGLLPLPVFGSDAVTQEDLLTIQQLIQPVVSQTERHAKMDSAQHNLAPVTEAPIVEAKHMDRSAPYSRRLDQQVLDTNLRIQSLFFDGDTQVFDDE